jgi:hypothetical protein
VASGLLSSTDSENHSLSGHRLQIDPFGWRLCVCHRPTSGPHGAIVGALEALRHKGDLPVHFFGLSTRRSQRTVDGEMPAEICKRRPYTTM